MHPRDARVAILVPRGEEGREAIEVRLKGRPQPKLHGLTLGPQPRAFLGSLSFLEYSLRCGRR